MAVQNLVYRYKKIYLITVSNIEAPPICHIQYALQFFEITTQPLKGLQSDPSEMALIEHRECVCVHIYGMRTIGTIFLQHTESYWSMHQH